MSLSKDLYLAILSMDAYNREYGAGINLGPGTSVGAATIQDRQLFGIGSEQYAAWQAAGFYAVAYDTPYGTVISYRGTDFAPDPGMINDITQGWPVGGGNYYELQSLMATDFLDAVQADDSPSSIILTGHSLGGGLAA